MFRTITKVLMGITAVSTAATTASVIHDIKNPGEVEDIKPIGEIEDVVPQETTEDAASEILNSAE